MEATPEPETQSQPDSTPITVSQNEERPAETYFGATYDPASGLEALSEAATSNFQYIRPVSIPMHSPGDINASPHSSNNLNFILNPTEVEGSIGMAENSQTPGSSANRPLSGVASPFVDPTSMPSATLPLDSKTVKDHEIAYLLRHFGETTGQW